jgi:hypothetical protein
MTAHVLKSPVCHPCCKYLGVSMPIFKIKVVDEQGAGLAGVSVNVTDCFPLDTNAEGLVQFLTAGRVTVTIAGQAVWTGDAAQAASPQLFRREGAGFRLA